MASDTYEQGDWDANEELGYDGTGQTMFSSYWSDNAPAEPFNAQNQAPPTHVSPDCWPLREVGKLHCVNRHFVDPSEPSFPSSDKRATKHDWRLDQTLVCCQIHDPGSCEQGLDETNIPAHDRGLVWQKEISY
jgi:hypothetical protein